MDIFKDFITTLNPLLKQIGFAKKRDSFYLEADKNYGVVNFQKSKESTKETISFTINFGIYSNILGRFQYGNSDVIKPEVEKCHWQSRIGNFMSGKPDYWWKVDISDNLDVVASNIMEIAQGVIMPEINKRISNEGLINCWMNENYAGTTEIGRFKYLTTLLKAKGDYNTLNQIVETFMRQSKGKLNSSIAVQHLKEIEYIT